MANTPPRGGASYTMVDIGELCKRTADKVNDHTARLERIEPNVALIPEMHTMIKFAVTPVARPRYVNYAIVVCAIAAIIIATSSVVRTTTIVDQRGQTTVQK